MDDKSMKITSIVKQNKVENIDYNNIEENIDYENENNIDLSENMDTNEEEICESMDKRMCSKSIESNVSEEQNSSRSEKSLKSEKSSKSEKSLKSNNKMNLHKDKYCWDCHKEDINISCRACPRSYHEKCPSLKSKVKANALNMNEFLCPECEDIMKAEEESNPLGCMSWLKGDVIHLSQLLKYTIITVRTADRNKTFSKPVSGKEWPQYQDLIINPMDLSTIEKNVKNRLYGSTKSFFADIKWIYHNCVVFNSHSDSAYINEAKNIIRVAKQECEEIEICPDCYYNYYCLEEAQYFAATCSRPHAIVWAKLSGHPYWPAKVVRYDDNKKLIDVRFFGTHDKCWLKPESCYFMSKEYPYNKKPSKFDETKFNEAIHDMNSHLDELEMKYPGLFRFYQKNTYFTIDKLYLTKRETDNKSIKSFNGIKIRNLTVNPTKFEIRNGIQLSNREYDTSSQIKEPNNKLKRSVSSTSSTDSPKSNIKRSYSQSVIVRQASDSSADSSRETDFKLVDEDLDRGEKFGENNNSLENGVENNWSEANSENSELLNQLKLNIRLKTVTVMGNSSEMIHINKSNKSTNNMESNQKLTNGNQKTSGSNATQRKSTPKFFNKSVQNLKEEELKAKLRTIEIKYRQLREEKIELEMKLNSAEEDKQELKDKLREFERCTEDIKRKQWCNNCLKEAILPCCWNTCYCTVECQHQHWPIHAKSCRRKVMATQQTNKS